MLDHEQVLGAFHRHFGGGAPTHLVRCPGRVNLIGEHLDYNGLPVLPIAIERGVALAFRPTPERRVRMANADAGFPAVEFELDDVGSGPTGHWANYLRAAASALAGRVGLSHGLEGLVASDLPIAAGLSSSSALVVATALALLTASDRPVDRLVLAGWLAEGERFVGTRGGGMDQAICLGARDGHACRIDFDPLRWTEVPVPTDWRFVVASSLVRAEKSGGVRAAYNRRTEECREALRAVLGALGLEDRGGYRALLAARDRTALLAAAEGLPRPLRGRFRHVVGEAGRVADAEKAMLAGDLPGFGRLLQASQASLRDDFEVSLDPLDRLAELATEAGAAGARLTGAGLGGCIVAAVARAQVEDVVAALTARFYRGRRVRGDFANALFVVAPSGAAAIEAL